MFHIGLTCLVVLTMLLTLALAQNARAADAMRPVISLKTGSGPELTFLSWDTEGGPKAQRNLLRKAGVVLRIKEHEQWKSATAYAFEKVGVDTYRVQLAAGREIVWQVTGAPDQMTMRIETHGADAKGIEGIECVWAFDPVVTCTTALASRWEQDEWLAPALLNAPDFGAMVMTSPTHPAFRGRLTGDRDHHQVDLTVVVPPLEADKPFTLQLTPVQVPAPKGLQDQSLWPQARRGWLNGYQATARWGLQNRPFSSPAGLMGNNVLSDPASCSIWMYADMAVFVPKIGDVVITDMVRRTLDFWLDTKMLPSGEMIGYWDYTHFLDANASPIIASWDYVEASRDQAWLAGKIAKLERAADFLAQRDIDGDGLVEATQSGNANGLQQPARSCAWWDAINCGHKDAYTNALIYRAWRCLAELETKLDRSEQARRYSQLADKLKAAYAKTFWNEKTGWLGWWRSADGQLHDYASPSVNGLAICYGLVDRAQGREILTHLRAKMKEVGFTRFDLGVPCALIPIQREDYLQPQAPGLGKQADGRDAFGQYMNGAVTPAQVLDFIAAHYVVGMDADGDAILKAMLERQNTVGFQNGAVNAYPKGIDWTTWDGKPAGYEGYLADEYRFLMAVLLREEPFRTRFYRPMRK